MPLPPDEFYRHAIAAADGEGRLPLSRMTGWDISPFEPEGLRVAPARSAAARIAPPPYARVPDWPRRCDTSGLGA